MLVAPPPPPPLLYVLLKFPLWISKRLRWIIKPPPWVRENRRRDCIALVLYARAPAPVLLDDLSEMKDSACCLVEKQGYGFWCFSTSPRLHTSQLKPGHVLVLCWQGEIHLCTFRLVKEKTKMILGLLWPQRNLRGQWKVWSLLLDDFCSYLACVWDLLTHSLLCSWKENFEPEIHRHGFDHMLRCNLD